MESASASMGSRGQRGTACGGHPAGHGFMEVPVTKRKDLLRKSALASVKALDYLHRVRRSGNARLRNRVMGEVSERRPKRKRAGGDAAKCLDRWRRLVMDPMRASFL